MAEVLINNREDLRNEIFRLKGLEQQQGMAIKQRFNGPGALFSTILSLFWTGSDQESDKGDGIFHQDFLGLISRIVLPFTLNKTIFKHSNFLIKALVGLVSQKASHYISEDSVSNIWDKAKELFTNFIKKDNKPEVISYRKIKKD